MQVGSSKKLRELEPHIHSLTHIYTHATHTHASRFIQKVEKAGATNTLTYTHIHTHNTHTRIHIHTHTHILVHTYKHKQVHTAGTQKFK